MTRDSISAPGWYGKILSLGDFVSRRLTPDWIDRCDDWLSRSMSSSKAELGDDWLRAYLSAPVWRFAWAPGVVDKRWWFGVLMPSCDNVGRYFPLVVVQARESPPTDRVGLDHLELWWSHVAAAAVQTLQDQTDLQAFEADLAVAPPWPASRPPGALVQRPMPDRTRVTPHFAAGLVDLAAAWASHEFVARLNGCSLWWPLSDAVTTTSMTVVPGLPDAHHFSELLTGRW